MTIWNDAWELAKEHGYDVEGMPLHFPDRVIETRRISKLDQESKKLFTLDFLLVTDALRGIWRERDVVEWPNGKTFVVSREGLTYLKSISGRPQDLLDIEKLQENQSAD